ncbi:DUF86 domain-containing protein [Leptolyngbya cf. ectocarpi LEGE 11479]|uniref:DUF86 domain-containing protein n=1 Tax=Leptolyngbya cf. ectocarpi LEGE 11479 TaxID=1828722 RepID=A0A928ZZT2_LEPEC|nr:HepT-like ribonuclease domain-containing protein [Leptolyngbya ectocarpi]MBE9070426.1 DUF86 domain-containing protein [Leptolyngbya cf. ectocarpi LEGE 11479]
MKTKIVPALPSVLADRLNVSDSEIVEFCQRWHIKELGLFGSAIRTDFREDSDIDVLVVFDSDRDYLNSEKVQQELAQLVRRDVDLTQKRLLLNLFSRAEILHTYRVLYPPDQRNFTSLIECDPVMTQTVRNHAALLDMVKAMEAIARFLAGRTYEDLLEDELFQSAVERQLEIMGEAANRLSPDFQTAHSDIDWSGAIALRNVIIHKYDDIDYARLWQIVSAEVPQILAQVKSLVPPLPETDE